jgi:hypothetical protein
MINRIRQFFHDRKAKQHDVQFRTGFLHALDRRLFPDSDPLLQEPDAQRLRLESSAFNTGAVWGDSVPVTSKMAMFIENARRTVL